MYLADSISRNLSQGQLGQIRGNNPRSFEWVTKRKRKPIYNFDPTNTGDPTQQGHLRFWFDLSRLEGYADGATVSGIIFPIIDYSGRGVLAQQANATQQPLFSQNALNGKSALLFDGINDSIFCTGMGTWGTGSYSLFAVFNYERIRPAHVEDVFDVGQLVGEMVAENAFSPPPTNQGIVTYGGPRGVGGNGYYQNVRTKNNGNEFHVVSASFVNNTTLLMGIDGDHGTDISDDSSGNGISGIGPHTGQFSGVQGYFGAGRGAGGAALNNFLHGHVCEFYGYDIGMSLKQIQQHEAYLALKWGIDNQLDGINPYRPVV